MKQLHKNLSPQPPHLVCVNCYSKLKLRASTALRKIPRPIGRQIIHVINMTEYVVCKICNQLVLSRNKRKGEHMILKHPYVTVCNNCIEKSKTICPICFSKVAFDEFWA